MHGDGIESQRTQQRAATARFIGALVESEHGFLAHDGGQPLLNAFTVALFAGGLVLLVLGAEMLVRGASRLAAAIGISPLVVGLTVVAWGTGSPELAVGVKAAVAGQPDIAVGNVVGSNIANILLILGAAALVAPLRVSRRVVRLDVPLMVAASMLTLALAFDGRLGGFDGAFLVALLACYTGWTISASRRKGKALRAKGEAVSSSLPQGRRALVFNTGLIAVGLYMLIEGSDWLIAAAAEIAMAFGLSELVIGLTIVAFGTSLPELATSAVAALRGQRDIAVGNAVGSNIFNILAVLGFTALAAPGGIPVASAALSLDIPIMIAVAVACLPVFFDGYGINRWNGALFVALYVGYITFLVLQGTQHAALDGFTTIMMAFVLPLVTLTLALIAVQILRRRCYAKRREEPGADEP